MWRDHEKKHSNGRTHVCEKCGRSFYEKVGLRKHKCGIAREGGKPSVEQWGIEQGSFSKVTSGQRLFSCYQCSSSFSSRSNLNSHMRLHSPDNPNVCNKCDKIFLCAAYLNKHLRVHHEGKAREKRSGDELPRKKEHLSQNLVARHHLKLGTVKWNRCRKRKWAAPEKKEFHCVKCRSSFMLRNTLMKHVVTHHASANQHRRIRLSMKISGNFL